MPLSRQAEITANDAIGMKDQLNSILRDIYDVLNTGLNRGLGEDVRLRNSEAGFVLIDGEWLGNGYQSESFDFDPYEVLTEIHDKKGQVKAGSSFISTPGGFVAGELGDYWDYTSGQYGVIIGDIGAADFDDAILAINYDRLDTNLISEGHRLRIKGDVLFQSRFGTTLQVDTLPYISQSIVTLQSYGSATSYVKVTLDTNAAAAVDRSYFEVHCQASNIDPAYMKLYMEADQNNDVQQAYFEAYTGKTTKFRLLGDTTSNSSVLEFVDTGGTDAIWQFAHKGSDHSTEADEMHFGFSPDNGSNYHQAIIFHPDQNADTDPLDVEFPGRVGINRKPSVFTNGLEIEPGAGGDGILLHSDSAYRIDIRCDTNRAGADDELFRLAALWNGTTVGWIALRAGDDTTNKDDGLISFHTGESGSVSERMRIEQDGGVKMLNLKSGATKEAAGAGTNELWVTSSHASLPDNVVMIG